MGNFSNGIRVNSKEFLILAVVTLLSIVAVCFLRYLESGRRFQPIPEERIEQSPATSRCDVSAYSDSVSVSHPKRHPKRKERSRHSHNDKKHTQPQSGGSKINHNQATPQDPLTSEIPTIYETDH